jgi:glyoxylase-like metal-dependent hydrolase (beta-lactamase superfamily II)
VGLPIENIKGVFISHMHEDHAGGLTAIAKRFCVYICKKKLDIFLPEKDGVSAFYNWFSALHLPNEDLLDTRVVTEGEIYQDENVKISAISTKHIMGGEFPSFGYKIEAEGKSVLYTGDLSENFCDYPKEVLERQFDAII